MTKFIYDTKSIMQQAWALTRKRVAQGRKEPISKIFSSALRQSWAKAKGAAQDFELYEEYKPDALKMGRYIELAETAERNGLKHGQSWICEENNCGRHNFQRAPRSWVGQSVCYVYAN
ncbi:hypothetical protein [Sodalis sp. RH16]|uniref:hypothetical protein n=1 Tax=Sodalis sp. RH16 TaxID=3394331 RepID=UPI0039B47432